MIQVGVDEAGRGPLAGPVVAAAVYLPDGVEIEGIADSKLLTPKKRRVIYKALQEKAIIGIGIVGVEEIDRINILQATLKAMALAVEKIPQAESVLVDGNQKPPIALPITCVVGGDRTVRVIGAASIVAKEYRDDLMDGLHKEYPVYGFDRHRGYGTAAHLAALREHGMSPVHRRSFSWR